MYRLNNLNRNVLISTDEVIRHAPSDHTQDPRMLEAAIIIAEERFISPALTYDLYQEMIAQKNLAITAGNKTAQQDLINASIPAGADPVTLKEGDIVNAFEYLNTEQKALWNQYLWKLTAEAVIMVAFPDAYVQYSPSGVIHKQPQSGTLSDTKVVTPSLASMKWMMDKKIMDRIDPLIASMQFWICKQKIADKTLYTKYGRKCESGCDGNKSADGIATTRKTPIVLGIYDDRDRYNNDNW